MAVLASNNALLQLRLAFSSSRDHGDLIAAIFLFQKRCTSRSDNIQLEPICPGTGSSKSHFLAQENKETQLTLR